MNRTFWDRVAGVYDLSQRMNRRVMEGLCAFSAHQISAGSKVLECAAGTGAISLAAASKAGHVLCTDPSLPMLEQARKKAARRGFANIEFAERALPALPDGDNSYDAVVAANVLHLLPQPDKAVRELWRVTAPGGVLVLPTFLTGKVGGGFCFLVRVYRLIGFQPRHAYTQESYRALFDRLGLPVETYTVIDGLIPAGIAVLRKPAQPEKGAFT